MSRRNKNLAAEYYVESDDGYGDEDYYQEDDEEIAIRESKKMAKQEQKNKKSKFWLISVNFRDLKKSNLWWLFCMPSFLVCW